MVSKESRPFAALVISMAPPLRSRNEATKRHKEHKPKSMKITFRSLYLKIFIWFWLAMIIISVGLFAAVALTRPTPTGRSWRDLTQGGPNAQKAAEIYELSVPGGLTPSPPPT